MLINLAFETDFRFSCIQGYDYSNGIFQRRTKIKNISHFVEQSCHLYSSAYNHNISVLALHIK